MPNNDYNYITESITRMLSRREHSVVEIRRKLALKECDDELVEAAITQFKDAGLQCDSRFTQSRIRSLVAKGSGPLKIKADIASHQISSDIVACALDELEVDFFQLACDVRRKKFGDTRPQNYTAKAKQMRFLQTRGFEMAHIQHAVNQ